MAGNLKTNHDPRALMKQAVSLHQSGRLDEALVIYKGLLKVNPKSFDLNHLTGVALFQQGLADQALRLIKRALKIDGSSAAAHSNLGSIQEALDKPQAALTSYDRAIALQPDFYQAHFKKGNVLQLLTRPEEALESYENAEKLQDKDMNLYNNKGAALRDLGRFDEALDCFNHAVSSQPENVNAYINKGNTLKDIGKYEEAVSCYDQALTIAPNHVDALINKGKALKEEERLDEALDCFDLAVKHHATSTDAFCLRGILLLQMGRNDEAMESMNAALKLHNDDAATVCANARVLADTGQYDEALSEFDRSLKLDGSNAHTWAYRASLLEKMNRRRDALGSYDRAITLWPGFVQAHINRAGVLRALKRYDEAFDSYKRAVELDPQNIAALTNLGNAFQEQGQYQAAVDSYDRAFKIDPRNVSILYNRGQTLSYMHRQKEACADYDRAYAINPDHKNLAGVRLHTKMMLCDWSACDEIDGFLEKIRTGEAETPPFTLIGLPSTPEDQMICAKRYMEEKYPPLPPLWNGETYSHDKIRVAYLSADFHRHATSYLIAGLFEQHDRDKFETYAFSFGPNDNSELRARLESSFTGFFDVAGVSDEEIAQKIFEKEIDILVDLKGYTNNSRINIVASRPAPVQVSYLGYPGTMAAPYMDYFVGDHRTVTPEIASFFSEKIIYMPGSYQVNDDKRFLPEETPDRADYGLPEDAFVFCSFNNTYKIMPEIFDIWMRLLKEVEGSVLWLFEGNDGVADNLRREAKKRDVDPARLVFAPKMKLEEHLARQKCADLFLDNIPCNAHTTASDALWVGLPLITCTGNTFAGRVAASLLYAHDLPELITENPDDYEKLALDLARAPEKLAALREKVIANRETAALFDTKSFTKNLESAYKTIWQRHQDGEEPEDFDVVSQNS